MIDDLITKHEDRLNEALEAELLKNPVRFWTRYGFPLVPSQMVARVESVQSCGPWVSLLEVCRLREIEERARAAGIDIPEPKPELARNGGPREEPPERDFPAQEEKGQSRPAYWPSPKHPPGALPPITAREPGRD